LPDYTSDMYLRVILSVLCLSAVSCGGAAGGVRTAGPASEPVLSQALAGESHLSELRQLTFEGENAEAYFSFEGDKASLQRKAPDMGCDRIYTLPLFAGGEPLARSALTQVSSGRGATTCSHFFPGGQELLYASTHLVGEACPSKPDMSHGYVWALYDSYDIFKARADGSELTRLTETKGYDAEGTVCGRDGSIVFTSVRDGDIDLYRMDKDGKNVRRLTNTEGYDGGAFFNADCSKIVWRASRPRAGAELETYRTLLKQGLVKPTKLELYVANADGSEAHQVTYLNAASFAPFWFPGRDRIIFSSNYGDPKGREFDLWAVDADGQHLERVTHAPGFDGFPMFSPDGQWLLFSSNRATAPGKSDTNLFLARWNDAATAAADNAPPSPTASAERIWRDAAWLSDPAREGRGVGTQGLAASGAFIEQRMRELKLEPLGVDGGYRVPFQITTALSRGEKTLLRIANKDVPDDQYTPLGYSSQGSVKGRAVLAGYALSDPQLGIDDFRGLDVRGKIVVARRFAPQHPKLQTTAEQRAAGDLRRKAFQAKNHGATALIVVDWPTPSTSATSTTSATPTANELPSEAGLPELQPEGAGGGGASIPVLIVKRAALASVWSALVAKKPVHVDLSVELTPTKQTVFNVVGKIPAGAPTSSKQNTIIIGAHYDHLGYGDRNSLAPSQHTPHLGADDNASGVATVLEIARRLSEQRTELPADVVVATFSAEEAGVLGSAALVASKPAWLSRTRAMINLDMVGRLRSNTLTVLGSQTADEWHSLVQAACERALMLCNDSGDGYGPSDQINFYTAGVPVLHLFTGPHSDYHKPSDTAEQLNAAGMAQVAQLGVDLVNAVAVADLHYKKLAAPSRAGDARSFHASLGTIPDYSGPPQGQRGVLLADVRPGGAADKAGMRRGDILIKLGSNTIGSVEDLMFVLMQAEPGQTVTAVVLRDGKELQLSATFQGGGRH